MEPEQFNEELRLLTLYQLGILDTLQNACFDRLTRLAAWTFNVPICLVSLIDTNRQWFKSRYGFEAEQTRRSQSFCSSAIALNDMLVITDAALDARFRDHQLVVDTPFIRFYAGQPLYAQNGHAVGALCLIDQVPRIFSLEQSFMLRDFAELVQEEMHRQFPGIVEHVHGASPQTSSMVTSGLPHLKGERG